MAEPGGAAGVAPPQPLPVAGRWRRGWWSPARRRSSPNFGPRPTGQRVDLVVLHSISLPPGVYGGNAIEQLFANRLDSAAHPYFAPLAGLAVSAHFLVRRDGQLLQFVSCDQRAWHAGQSTWRGRDNCNDFSIGIELEGLEGDAFEAVQYPALADLLRAISRRYPVSDLAGHEQVAPGRKHDPGPGFDWAVLRQMPGFPAALGLGQAATAGPRGANSSAATGRLTTG